MKRIAIAVLAALALAPAPARGGPGRVEVSVMIDGRYHESLSAYKAGPAYYLSAKEAGAVYGAQVYWYPVSGRIQMSLRGRQIQFLANSDSATIAGRSLLLDGAVLLRASRAYIPLSFFLSEEFSSWAGVDSVFNRETGLLSVDKRSTVGQVRWFSYGAHTRILFELAPRLSYSSAVRGLKGFELTIPRGTIASAEESEIADGLVKGYSMSQGPGAAKLKVSLARPGLHWSVKELSPPRRLAVDFYSDEPPKAVAAASPAPPAASTQAASAQPASARPVEDRAAAGTAQAGGSARRRIVIDAGHGGKDGGATGIHGASEKTLNLLAARELAELLKEEGSFDVVLTRSDDTFVPLSERSRIANEAGADLFVSLHCNASRKSRDEGFEVYFLSEKASDPGAQRLAEFENSVIALEGKSAQDEEAVPILKEMTKTENINAASKAAALLARALGKRVSIQDRGVKQAAFYVLRGTYAPAVLVEMAYVTNKKDAARLESERYRRRIIDGIYAGVLDFARREGWRTASSD